MTALPTIADRRRRHPSLQRGPQRRSAFRISMPMPVHIYAPAQLVCELRDISFTGVGFDRELPFPPGVEVTFSLEEPTRGTLLVPTSIVLRAEVVRVEFGHTGLRFFVRDGDEPQAVHDLVTAKQRTLLAARRAQRDPRS